MHFFTTNTLPVKTETNELQC